MQRSISSRVRNAAEPCFGTQSSSSSTSSPYCARISLTHFASASADHSWPVRWHTRWNRPSRMASANVTRCRLYGSRPDRMSCTRVLNGLSSPLWVLMMRTSPPQISSAIAALIRPARSLWNAASSMITRPCLPRRLRGVDDSAVMRWPLAKVMENLRTDCFSSPSMKISSPDSMSTAKPCIWAAHCAQSRMNSMAMSFVYPMYQTSMPLAAAAHSTASSASDQERPIRRDFSMTLTRDLSSTHLPW